jgi:hypothetical protein
LPPNPFLTTHAQAQQPPAPPLVQQLNNGNWLPQAEAESLRDELYYQRAVFAYMTMLPALNTIGLRNGSEAAFGKGYNVLPIWKDRMDSARSRFTSAPIGKNSPSWTAPGSREDRIGELRVAALTLAKPRERPVLAIQRRKATIGVPIDSSHPRKATSHCMCAPIGQRSPSSTAHERFCQ